MRLYIDDISVQELIRIIITLPRSIYDLIKEELFWWLVLYKYEIYTPDDINLKRKKRRVRK